jgi:hypothetical protein
MASLTDLPELIGFFSYSRDDDDDSRGALSELRDCIQRELRGQLGRSRTSLRLWQDKQAIAPGKLWEGEIKAAIEQSVFFIPIVTPTAVRSQYCKHEFDAFLARERALGRDDLVFPIYYIRVPGLEDEEIWKPDPVLKTIGERQWTNWRDLRLLDMQDKRVRAAIAEFCAKLAETLQRPVASPEEKRQQAEAERLAAEAAARNRAEQERLEEEATRRVAEQEARRQAERERAEAEQRQADAKRRAEQDAQAHDAALKREKSNEGGVLVLLFFIFLAGSVYVILDLRRAFDMAGFAVLAVTLSFLAAFSYVLWLRIRG